MTRPCWQERAVCAHRCCCLLCVSKTDKHKRASQREREREGGECCGGRLEWSLKSLQSHLALSLPWDLMKFMSLYLDRKVTSWLLVLKWKKMTYITHGNIWRVLAGGGSCSGAHAVVRFELRRKISRVTEGHTETENTLFKWTVVKFSVCYIWYIYV